MSLSEFLKLIAVPLLSGAGGVAVTAWLALGRFRRERAFEKRLEWYERACSALRLMEQRIEIALTFQEDRPSADHLVAVWRDVQKSHLEIDRVANEGQLFGSEKSTAMVDKVAKKVQKVANQTGAFDPNSLPTEDQAAALLAIGAVPEILKRASVELAAEARSHLGLR